MTIVFVSFGLDRKVLANANCSPFIFMAWLRSICDVTDPCIILDLTDENGNLQNVASICSTELASSKLLERKEYILVKVERNKHSVTVTPLLQNWKPIIKEQIADISTKQTFSRGSGKRQSLH